MDSRFDWIKDRLDALDADGLRRQLTPRAPVPGTMQLQSQGQALVNFGTNDYLGLATAGPTPTPSSETPQSGSGASALVSGHTPIHQELQTKLAELEGTEGCVLFPTGFAANLGTISTLADAGDVILSDAANHASIIDGCRLSKAQRFIYPHLDTSAVKALLEVHRRRFTRAYIVTDSVFSMDGDFAPLETLCDLADYYDAALIVDEAHATGVFGRSGSGLCEHLGVKSRVPIRIGTLSKAIGAMGGFVAAPQVVLDYLVNRARSMIYSTAMPPMVAAAALANLQIIRSEPARRERVLASAARLREQIAFAWRLPRTSSPSQIIPLIVGSNNNVRAIAARLQDDGFFVPAIRPPTVPDGTARLRISLSSLHTNEEIDRLAENLIACNEF